MATKLPHLVKRDNNTQTIAMAPRYFNRRALDPDNTILSDQH
jgi:hypothetical protein